ncbi:flavin reductase family protein [Rhodococcus sp. NPDC060176]|uniref:flavin reductase family protein n=1 Tax=Rhodococcus sp. NPDC060176 TaxID=3347062 RepID=UPI003649E631
MKKAGTEPLHSALPIEPRQFRNTMGKFTTGVTVITAQTGDGDTHGMTANGFISMSLTPPLVGISLGNASRMAAVLHSSGRFGVSFLSAPQIDYSMHFAGSPNSTLKPEFEERNSYKFISGATAFVGAGIEASHQIGDHTLFVGRVDYLETHEHSPLVLHGGKYETLRVESLAS